MWHYANFHGRELLVVGHSIRRNDCILVELDKLPMNETIELRRIAQSRVGQENSHLTELLKTLSAPNRMQNWFEYLCYKMEQRNGPVFILPLKEIQDSLEEDQRAIFKGYGKGRKNKYLESLDDGAAPAEIEGDLPPQHGQPVNTSAQELVPSTQKAGNLEYKMDMLLETLVDQNRQTQQLLGKLIGALTEAPAEPADPVSALEAREWAAESPKAKRPVSRSKKTENAARAQV
jgi:hypothetical protein